MPNLRIPIRNGPHRIAAIALYRALLTQCRALPFVSHQRDELQNIVRNRFKQARHSQSTQRLRISFQAGYEAIDHLDAAVARDEGSRRYLSDLLERAPVNTKRPPPIETQSHTEIDKTAKSVETEGAARQPKSSIFDRPLQLEKLSGPRHVPVLFNANRIPVLRIKKPQPESLSRFLRQRIKQRQNRHDRRWRLYAEQDIARREDEWDDIIIEAAGEAESKSMAQAMSSPSKSTVESTWASALQAGIKEVEERLDEEREKNRVMAEKMQAVVDREQELFDKERADRQRYKRREYRYRKRQRMKGEHTTTEKDNEPELTSSSAARG